MHTRVKMATGKDPSFEIVMWPRTLMTNYALQLCKEILAYARPFDKVLRKP